MIGISAPISRLKNEGSEVKKIFKGTAARGGGRGGEFPSQAVPSWSHCIGSLQGHQWL